MLYLCEGQTAPPFTTRQMTKPSRCNWHTHAHTLAASRCVRRATRRCDRLKQRQDGWIEEKQSDRMAEEQGVWRALSKLLKSNYVLYIGFVNTCISYDDTDHTKTSCWLTRLRPGPLRSSEWERPVRIHSSAGQCDGSHDGWWTSGTDSFLMER